MTVHQWVADWSSWGWPSVANHLWQATLLAIVAFAAAALLKNAPARARYAVWLIASAKFVLPSALLVSMASRFGLDASSLFASTSDAGDGLSVIYQLTAPVIHLDQSTNAAPLTLRGHNEWLCALSVAWLIGCVLFLALWWRKRRLYRFAMRSTSESYATREKLALNRVRSWLGIRRDVALSVLPGTIEPGVWGVWRPVVVLPESMAEELSDAELEAVMMHEMIHVARWDNLIADLHRLVCCVLWFHPMVWMLDRLLLAERERACDEEVIRLGGAPEVYASSLLKVLRFCLGWNVAGASNATGSNLGRRIERIMSRNAQVRFSVWHRAAVGSIAVLVITLSIAAGILTREGVAAQSRKPREGVIGGIPGGVPGGVPGGTAGGVPGGVAGGIPGFAFVSGQDNLIERLDQAPLTSVEFKNSAKAPLTITDARAKAVLRVPDEPGDEHAVLPVVTVTNNTDRRIRGYALEFRNGLERRVYYEFVPSRVERLGVHTSGAQRRLLFLAGGPSGWTVRVAGVLFDDGDVWGTVPPPPPPPPPPIVMQQLEEAPETAIKFSNLEGAPLSITSATAKAARIEKAPLPDGADSSAWLVRPIVRLINNTGRRIASFALEFANPEAKTYVAATIEPYGSYTLGAPRPNVSASPVLGSPENLDRMEVRILGVKFEDGELWGEMFPGPPPPPPPPAQGADSPKLIRKPGGVMMTSATHRVEAEYPSLARVARISGSVVVEVTVDEAGAVTSARAISGHPLLKDAAVNAARQWQFSPTMLSGVPVGVIGTLTFTFEP